MVYQYSDKVVSIAQDQVLWDRICDGWEVLVDEYEHILDEIYNTSATQEDYNRIHAEYTPKRDFWLAQFGINEGDFCDVLMYRLDQKEIISQE